MHSQDPISHYKPKAAGSLFYQFMMHHLDFLATLVSVHYPFTESEIELYWDVLIPGTAHYPAYIPTIEWTYQSELGLCFNQNIRWTDKLKDRWQIGFDDPYEGYLVGLGSTPVQYNDTETLKAQLPLSISEHRWQMVMLIMDSYSRQGSLEDYLSGQSWAELESRTEKVERYFPRLSFEEFEGLYKDIGNLMVYNRSIWYNTLYYEIGEQYVFSLLRLKRYQVRLLQMKTA